MFSSNTSQVDGGYQISRSLRFNSADSAYLNRTPASAGNRRTWTWSGWVKRSNLSAAQTLFSASNNSTTQFFISLLADNTLQALDWTGSVNLRAETLQVFRDSSAWYHVVFAVDTTQATSTNRWKLYVNGEQVTSFSGSSSYPSQNYDTAVNATVAHAVGREEYADTNYLSGYMTEINFIDGQALTPSSFGETNAQTGVWQPKAYSGSYGTNGFYLNFSDNSNTTAATLGKDYSGNGNNWTPNNFSVTAGAGNDSLVDTPTAYGTDTGAGGTVRGNYATWNPVDIRGTGNVMLSLANGNLQATGITSSWRTSKSTIGMSSGKWYCEATLTSISGTLYARLGIANSAAPTDIYLGFDSNGWAFTGSWSVNDVIGIAFDADAGTLAFYLNNSLQGTSYSGLTSGPYFFAISIFDPTVLYVNFGQRPFAYTAPSGFKALCTQNLPTPAIGATSTTQAGKYFNPVLYTGTGSSLGVTGIGFQPDFVWIKERNGAADHGLYDAVRGVQKQLESNTTDAETTETTGLTAFNTDGFTVGALAQLNTNTDTYVAWNWKANGAGSSNTAGSITSTVSANTTSGFSVVTATAQTSGVATVGHGLGVAPSMVIIKGRGSVSSWGVYHISTSAGGYLALNSTAAYTADGAFMNSIAPTSSVFTLGSSYANYGTFVAYCFAEVPGYSAFGSYTGNGSSDGPFVFTNMRPAYVMIKRTDTTGNWIVWDTTRNTFNVMGEELYPNLSNAGSTTTDLDVLSNGFKLRNTTADFNARGGTYI